MPIVDHLGITVADVPSAIAQYDPILTALGFAKHEADGSASWYQDGETELILRPAHDGATNAHQHGQIGWQHLAFAVDSPDDVQRLHDIAVAAGWTVVREPKLYPRFTERYFASFLEDQNGIRIEFMYNP